MTNDDMTSRPPTTTKRIAIASFGALALSAGVLWWLMDDRRGVAWAVAFVRRRFRDVPHLSIESLASWLGDARRDSPQLLDVRSREEFGISHLPGAIQIDYRTPLSAGLESLDARRPVVVYCSAGYRSSMVARELLRAGFAKVCNLEGGIFAWANAGLPIERDGRPANAVHPCLRLFSRMVKPRIRLKG
jgi:rhodanese-related sulfurtransferase